MRRVPEPSRVLRRNVRPLRPRARSRSVTLATMIATGSLRTVANPPHPAAAAVVAAAVVAGVRRPAPEVRPALCVRNRAHGASCSKVRRLRVRLRSSVSAAAGSSSPVTPLPSCTRRPAAPCAKDATPPLTSAPPCSLRLAAVRTTAARPRADAGREPGLDARRDPRPQDRRPQLGGRRPDPPSPPSQARLPGDRGGAPGFTSGSRSNTFASVSARTTKRTNRTSGRQRASVCCTGAARTRTGGFDGQRPQRESRTEFAS